MAKFQIQIAGEYLDIPDSVTIAYDIGGNDFASLNTRSGIKSNDFNLPATIKNRVLLAGGQRIDAQLELQNRVVSRGFVQVVERRYRDGVIKIAFFGSNSNWLAAIENKTLRDLDFSRFDHDYNLQNVVAGLTSTRGYCYPMVNYGRWTDRSVNEVDINEQELVPAIFAKDVFLQIFREAGIAVSGSLLNDGIFQNMILPWNGLDKRYPSKTFNRVEQSISNRILPLLVSFGDNVFSGATIQGNPAFFLNTTITGIFINASAYGSITVDINYDFTVSALISTLEIRIVVRDSSGAVTFSFPFFGTTVNGNFTGNIPGVVVPAGGRIIFEFKNGNTGTTLSASVVYKCNDTKMRPGKTLPDISQKDFVRYIVVYFGVLLSYNETTKTLRFDLANQLYAGIAAAPDWSKKVDLLQERNENYTDFIQDYAQSNRLGYADVKGLPTGRGVFFVQDKNLPAVQDFYTAPFAGTGVLQAFTGANDISLPIIQIFDNDDDREIDEEADPRILLISVASGRTPVSITDGWTSETVTAYNVPSFSGLSFADAIKDYYQDIVKIINNRSSFLLYLRLNASDLAQFNQRQVVRIDTKDISGYFYVSLIENFNAEDASYKTTLLKL